MKVLGSIKSSVGRLLALVVIVATCWGCGVSPVVVSMADVNRNGWSEQVDVCYDNHDTSSLYDMSIALRVGNRFQAKELPLHVVFVTPDSLRYEERVVLPVKAAPLQGDSRRVEILVPYRRDVRLASRGIYGVSITPECSVVGIEAIGVVFENR